MTDLIELAKQQAAEIASAGHNGWGNTMLELAAALEAAQMGLRYAVRVWVLSDEIEWSEEEIDKAVERIIDSAKKEAGRG